MVKVSIIIPVYNTEKYLERCLDSAIKQTLTDIEIICINDGSTDNSLNILKKYREKDKRVIIIDIKNGGAARARNIGIMRAKGKFIGFIDSDDYVDEKYFENLYEQSKRYDMVRGIRLVDGRKAVNPYGCLVPSIIKREFLLKNNLLFPYKKVGEDSTLKRLIYKQTKKILDTEDNGIYYHYEKRPGSLSNYKIPEEIDPNQPLVSIILTLYEIKKEYLLECLDSLLNQTYKNIEIIAIDDCSPTIDYSDITKLSPKIKLFRNEKNLKMNKTVNKAFGLAQGKYIVRLGSDDIFNRQLIEKEVKVLEESPEYGAVCCELQRFGAGSFNRIIKVIGRPKKWDLETILNGSINGVGYAGGMMFRKELLKHCSINESYEMCEDFDFHLQILEHMPITSIHEILYYYRSHETNLCKTVKKERRWDIIKSIIQKHKDILSSNK